MKDPHAGEIERFLRTGNSDLLFLGWPGQNIIDKAQQGTKTLTDALVAEVRRREATAPRHPPVSVSETDLTAFTRTKVGPMVRGLFPRKECDPVLALLERSVVFLTRENIDLAVRKASFLSTAWQVANLYLGSIGAKPLGKDRRRVVGLSVDETCYVSSEYFAEDDPFADFVVHEAAHVFHNTKRRMVGLKETRRREWLLPIEFRKRETFAYACEAYSRILETGKTAADRLSLFDQLRQGRPPPDDSVAPEEYFCILSAAVSRRNGWKAILAGCSTKAR